MNTFIVQYAHREEFRAAVTQMIVDYDGLSCEDFDTIFNTVDIDGSGEISFVEFKNWFDQITRSFSAALSRSSSLTSAISGRRRSSTLQSLSSMQDDLPILQSLVKVTLSDNDA